MKKFSRMDFLLTSGLTACALLFPPFKSSFASTLGLFDHPGEIITPKTNEDVFGYINRINGKFDQTRYRKIVGSDNAFKEGDVAQGVAAFNENSRINARILIANTKIKDLYETPLFTDDLLTLIQDTTDQNIFKTISNQTLAGLRVSGDHIVIRNGRVRAGYRCREYLFGRDSAADKPKSIVCIIGERPGSGHHNFSSYLSAPLISTWKEKGKLDHDQSKVVSGISDTALRPELAAKETVRILAELFSSPA